MSPPPTCMFQFTTTRRSDEAAVGAGGAAMTTGGPTLRRQLFSDARSSLRSGPIQETPGVAVSVTATSRRAIEWLPTQPLSTVQLSASEARIARRDVGIM